MALRFETDEFRSRSGAGPEGAAPGALRASGVLVRDAALVERAADGDRGAFADLYRSYGPMVHGVLLARVGRGEAEDLTQEVFLRAWRRLGELRDAAAVGAWLAAIARSCASDWARADGRRRGREGLAVRGSRGGEAARADGVLGAIRRLPEAYREPLVLRFVAGLTGPQIAHCLGMTHGAVRVNLHRGMSMLRELLSEDWS